MCPGEYSTSPDAIGSHLRCLQHGMTTYTRHSHEDQLLAQLPKAINARVIGLMSTSSTQRRASKAVQQLRKRPCLGPLPQRTGYAQYLHAANVRPVRPWYACAVRRVQPKKTATRTCTTSPQYRQTVSFHNYKCSQFLGCQLHDTGRQLCVVVQSVSQLTIQEGVV